jgi:ribosome-binding factor A
MNSRKRRRRFDQPLCDSYGPDDGVDPRDWAKAQWRPVRNRKALQLCRQVERALHLALAGLADPLLHDLLVSEVRLFPDSSRLLVRLGSSTATAVDLEAVSRSVQKAAGRLRQEVAAAIHRRKTPELIFQVGMNPA